MGVVLPLQEICPILFEAKCDHQPLDRIRSLAALTISESDIQIHRVEQDGKDGVFVTFSDGTAAGYIVEELLALRPAESDNPKNHRQGNQIYKSPNLKGAVKRTARYAVEAYLSIWAAHSRVG